MNDEEIVARLSALPKEIMPERDLRPGIAERLAVNARPLPRRRRIYPYLVAAAMVALAVGVTRWYTLRTVELPVAEQNVASSTELVSFHAEETRWSSEISSLQRALADEQTRLSPTTLAIVQRNLAIIDRAIAESRAALEHDPNNRELRQMVISVYRQKADLLRNARTVGL